MYRKYFKRLTDISLSFAAILCLSPLFLALSFLIRVRLGNPVLFKQMRPGMREEIFTLYKFRTMTAEFGENGNLLPDGMRVTRFGNWLRFTSLDEIPQLFNILKGDMSIVGPRPLLEGYLPYYTACERFRHSVRPGLTGSAQIGGRNTLGWDQRLKKDLEYVQTISFKGDVKIILETIQKVVKKENILDRQDDKMTDLSDERRGLFGDSNI